MSFILDLLAAIGRNPGTTIEELTDELGQHVSKVRNNCHQAKHQELLTVKLDDVTHKPGYHLSPAGKQKLASAGRAETKPAKAATKPPKSETQAPKAETKAAENETPAPETAANHPGSGQSNPGALSVIYDIRCAIGDPEGKIMLGDLAATIASRELQRSALSVELGEAEAQIRQNHDALAQLLPPDWPIDPSDMSTDDIIKQLAATLAATRAPAPATSDDDAVDILDAAKGYIVSASKRKPRRINRPEAARTAALAAVRNGAQRADVFALVPVGTAKRGAEWAGQ